MSGLSIRTIKRQKRKKRNRVVIFAAVSSLTLVFLIYNAINLSRAPTRTIRNIAEKAQSWRKDPAHVNVTVVNRFTSEAVGEAIISVGKENAVTDSSGTARITGLNPGQIDLMSRAPGFLLFKDNDKIRSGTNTVTIGLMPDTETERPEPAESAGRIAYLTIDDGPSTRWTPKVLDILEREKVPATFFLVGWRAEDRPKTVRRIYVEGHEIGNHTYSHNYRSLYSGGVQNYLASLSYNGRIIQRIVGINPRITRPPGGSIGNFKRGWHRSIAGDGYVTALWNVSTGDGSTRTTGNMMVENAHRYLDRLEPKEPAIILMHDVRAPVVYALPKIIGELRKRGFVFSVIKEDVRIDRLVVGPSLPRGVGFGR